MSKRVRFNSNVSRVEFDKSKGTKRSIETVEGIPLADEQDIAARNSTFQAISQLQRQQLHEHHIRKRKKSRLFMRPDIADQFWVVYENKAWERLVELAGNSPITAQEIERMSLTAITSVDKNEIVKEWKEQLMILFPIVEQFHMVPFHDRWIQSQFKDEENIKKMKEMLAARGRSSSQWFVDLVNDLALSPETPPSTPQIYSDSETDASIVLPATLESFSQEETTIPECNLDQVTEVLNELEELNPEIFTGILTEESAPVLTDESITDSELATYMEGWEEQQMTDVLDSWNYDYLLENEVHLEIIYLYYIRVA